MSNTTNIVQEHHPAMSWATFFVITLASKVVGNNCQKMGLPSISGFLLTGIICGPCALLILGKYELPRLVYINDFVIAFIATSAGSELYLKEMRELLKSILLNTLCIGCVTLPLCTMVGYGMGGSILLSWQGDYGSSCRWSMAAIAGGILVGRSPASIIAIIAELKVRTRIFVSVFVVSEPMPCFTPDQYCF
jgi:Kef-type K+ transport system membrane component KefB